MLSVFVVLGVVSIYNRMLDSDLQYGGHHGFFFSHADHFVDPTCFTVLFDVWQSLQIALNAITGFEDTSSTLWRVVVVVASRRSPKKLQ